MVSKKLFTNGKGIDPAYNGIVENDHPEAIKAKKFCLELWKCFEKYADEHFVAQIKIDFYARFWEMYLTCALQENGFLVSCPKPGPDLLLSYEKLNIWVEAIAPGNGSESSEDKVPKLKAKIAQEVPTEQIILRYRSAIAEKSKKYRGYIEKNIIAKGDPFIIAVNGCKVRSARTELNPPRIVRSVFPIGDKCITVDKYSGNPIDTGFCFKKSISKASGAQVSTDIFLDEKYSYISGILFSVSDCCNRPDVKGDDFILIHNPTAENPVPQGLLGIGCEYVAELSVDEYKLRFYDWTKNA